MRFGENWETFKNRPTGDGGNYIRAMKEGKTVVRFLTEPRDWIGYREHYNPNPGGFSFPCTEEKDCPGCNSNQEKMKGTSSKVAVACLVEDKWVNVYKIPKKFADRLERRAERWETLMDRDYEITRIGNDAKTDYDVESGDKGPLKGEWNVPDIRQMLMDNYNQTWGDDADEDSVFGKDDAVSTPVAKDAESKVYAESELRAMEQEVLIEVLLSEGHKIPDDMLKQGSNEIVDWLIAEQDKVPF